MATSLRVASSLTICLLTVWLSVLTLAAARYADDKLTPHWKRCREIVIRNETRACTASQNADTCSARKAWQSKLQARSDYNCTEDTPHCPEAPRDLNVEVYKTKILRDDSDPNNKLYPGLNVSWKVSQTGPELETEAKTFEVRVSDVPERGTYIALITVNLTSDDYGQDGLASITYDCMYPLPVHSTLPDKPKSYRLHVVVKTLPHDETFANITVDVPEDLTTTAPNTTPTPKPTDDSDSAKETTNTPGAPTVVIQSSIDDATSSPLPNSALVPLIVVGALLLTGGIIAAIFYFSRRRNQTSMFRAAAPNSRVTSPEHYTMTSTNNGSLPSGMEKRTLLLLQATDADAIIWKHLSQAISRRMTTHSLLEPNTSSVATGVGVPVSRMVQAQMMASDGILLVSSPKLSELLARGEDLFDCQCLDDSQNVLLLSLYYVTRHWLISPRLRAKIAIVYGGEATPCPQILSHCAPASSFQVPGDMENLLDRIRQWPVDARVAESVIANHPSDFNDNGFERLDSGFSEGLSLNSSTGLGALPTMPQRPNYTHSNTISPHFYTQRSHGLNGVPDSTIPERLELHLDGPPLGPPGPHHTADGFHSGIDRTYLPTPDYPYYPPAPPSDMNTTMMFNDIDYINEHPINSDGAEPRPRLIHNEEDEEFTP